jgi:hypothetical protein
MTSKDFIDEFIENSFKKALANLELTDPLHLKMTDNRNGEFPNSYKLTKEGIKLIINKIFYDEEAEKIN